MNNLANISTTWLDAAEDRAETMHNPKVFIGGGLLGGLILGSLLNPLTGVASLAYGLWMAWAANEDNSDQVEAVNDGLIAHLLDKKQLRAYLADVGEEQVKSELATAIERELKLSDAARSMAHSLGLMGNGPTLSPPRLRLRPVEAVTDVNDGGDAPALTSAINSEDASTVAGSYGFDKLKGISLKQFREMLRAQGVTHENGSFRSVEAIDLPGSEQFVRKRLEGFWQEFHSKKINHAVYFTFGLQNGGGRSQDATSRFLRAKQYVEDWFSLYVEPGQGDDSEPF